MTEILFYHLEHRPLEEVLPILLEKSLERGWRAMVQVGQKTTLQALDKALWTFRDDSFLPHAIAGQPSGAGGADQTSQELSAIPVLLCGGEENPNAAQIRFYVGGAVPDEGKTETYERIVFLFDGHDPDAVNAARAAWKSLSAKHDTTYWQQEPAGRWVKKA